MTRLLQIINIIALIVTLAFNYLSNTGLFYNNTMASVSAKYENLFTPAGYAFSIWGVIYLGLIAFVAYQGRSLWKKTAGEDITLETGWWFAVSCLANCLWIIAWLYEFTGISVILMIILLFSLIKIILRTGMELHEVSLKKLLFVWWPFSLYTGWITVALIANVAAYLTKIGWSGFGLPDETWAIIMIIIAGGINVFVIWTRNLREFAAVGIWGLIAVAASTWDFNPSVAYAAVITAVIIVFNVALHAYQNRESFIRTFSGNKISQ